MPFFVALMAFVGYRSAARGVEAMERARAGYDARRAAVLDAHRAKKKKRRMRVAEPKSDAD